MRKFMLDTHICIYTIKNKPESLRPIFNAHDGQMCVSRITHMELVCGAERSAAPAKNLAVVESFLARLDVLDFDQAASEQAAQIRAELGKKGAPIGPYDALIAGHARSLGLTVVTNNTREFERVAGLRIVDWTVSA